MSDHPLVALVKAANYDLTSAKAKLSEVERQIAALGLASDERCTCGHCGISLPSKARWREHYYLTHGGPEPSQWVEAEALAVDPA